MIATTRISLVIADDHPMFLDGLAAALKKDFMIIGMAVNGADLLTMVRATKPNIVLVDLRMPFIDGLSAAKRIIKDHPATKVVIISFLYEKELEDECKACGIRGYLIKNLDKETLLQKLSLVAEGGTAFRQSDHEWKVKPTFASNWPKPYNLSKREMEVISLIRKGFTSALIASALYISINTVEAHRKRIFRKLHVKNVQGLIELSSRLFT